MSLLIESGSNPKYLANRRPAPKLLFAFDLQPLIYALGSHKLPAGDFIIFRPDGTAVYTPAATDVTPAANWHTANGTTNKALMVRVSGATSGTWRLDPRFRPAGWSNPAGVYSTYPVSTQVTSTQVNQGLQVTPNIHIDQTLLTFIATADLIVPATGCRVEVSILEFPRTT